MQAYAAKVVGPAERRGGRSRSGARDACSSRFEETRKVVYVAGLEWRQLSGQFCGMVWPIDGGNR